jgi:KipI family sensor histidine kinase inhibitor
MSFFNDHIESGDRRNDEENDPGSEGSGCRSGVAMSYTRIYSLSESAINVEFGEVIDEAINQQVMALHHILQKQPFEGFVESVPAFTTLTIFFRPEKISLNDPATPIVKEILIKLLSTELQADNFESRLIKIPVHYNGPDLDHIAAEHHISKEGLIKIHQQHIYKVYMMGFLPGFAYMGAVDDTIATPRKATPRSLVEAGSVGIAGKQTGIYPFDSPGGWQIIGKTPLRLFDLKKDDPFLLKAGDAVQFYSITENDLEEISEPEFQEPENEPDILVIKPGILSSIQDEGRMGFRSYGVPVSGAMDLGSFHAANAMVGNERNAACIECTMGGLQLQFKKNSVIAITGSGTAFINGRPIKTWQPLKAFAKDVLELKFNNEGIRSYVAVKGGFDTRMIMNSRSTYHRAGIGHPLKKEQGLLIGITISSSAKMISDKVELPAYQTHHSIRLYQGSDFHLMEKISRDNFFGESFRISNQSDRMGYRLEGTPLRSENNIELLSSAVTKGTVQLTPSGQLIILMSDCQTTGGYPWVAQVAAADLDILAQLKPGDDIHLTQISFEESERLYLIQQKRINDLFH